MKYLSAAPAASPMHSGQTWMDLKTHVEHMNKLKNVANRTYEHTKSWKYECWTPNLTIIISMSKQMRSKLLSSRNYKIYEIGCLQPYLEALLNLLLCRNYMFKFTRHGICTDEYMCFGTNVRYYLAYQEDKFYVIKIMTIVLII